MLKSLQSLVTIVLFWIVLLPLPAQASPLDLGKTVFEAQCSACHDNGGNIIRRGKTLKQGALKHNGYDSLDAVVDLVTNGKNNMSAYRDRLSSDEIQAVSSYVLARASANWKSTP